jgi:hypothetical protein
LAGQKDGFSELLVFSSQNNEVLITGYKQGSELFPVDHLLFDNG